MTHDIGIHALTFPDYIALDRWGSSSLRAMRRGPPARVQWERGNAREDTDATILGSAIHCALLTPTLFAKHYAIKPAGMSFASKEGKLWRDDPERAGRTILSHDAGETVTAIVAALRAKEAVRKSLVDATHVEMSITWDCPETDEPCKARPDWIDGRYVYDLKTTAFASTGRLALRAFTQGWMHQLAHYRTGAIVVGMPLIGGRLVVVDSSPPHFIHCLEVKVDALDLLELENIETLKALRECRLSGVWQDTSDEWLKVEPPPVDAPALDLDGAADDVAADAEAVTL